MRIYTPEQQTFQPLSCGLEPCRIFSRNVPDEAVFTPDEAVFTFTRGLAEIKKAVALHVHRTNGFNQDRVFLQQLIYQATFQLT